MQNFLIRHRYYYLLFLVVVAVLVWSPVVARGGGQGLKVWFFDVGQGDAQFLDFSDGNQILIDGGPDGKALQGLGKAMAFYDRDIDVMILTHPHKDHIFGLIEVLKRYKVGKIILPKVDFESAFYKEFLEIAREKNISLEYLGSGDKIKIGEFAEFDFLSPQKSNDDKNFTAENESFGAKGQDLNDSSLVSKFVFGDSAILFTGDAGENIEKEILAKEYNIKADILKVGHHGSKYSSSEEFLKAVSPEYAVIQVGEGNKYGHPTEQTISRLAVIGAKVLRNDLNGDILFTINNKQIKANE